MKSNYDEFPIDMVYLWCNGQDPDFIKKKKNTNGIAAMIQVTFYPLVIFVSLIMMN